MTLIPELQRDLVDAAARMSRRRQRFGVWVRLTPVAVAAAALIGATVLLLGGDGSDPEPSSRSAAGSPQDSAPKPPPRRGPDPMPGTVSRAVRFAFRGVGYSIVGFRGRSASRGGVICTRQVELGGGGSRRVVGATCAGERLLRRGLDDHPVRTVGGGGQPIQLSGFARADVTRIAVLDSQYPTRVVLSEPWSPEPWQGEPIRFFLVLIDAPPDRARTLLRHDLPRLEARLTSGETVEGAP